MPNMKLYYTKQESKTAENGEACLLTCSVLPVNSVMPKNVFTLSLDNYNLGEKEHTKFVFTLNRSMLHGDLGMEMRATQIFEQEIIALLASEKLPEFGEAFQGLQFNVTQDPTSIVLPGQIPEIIISIALSPQDADTEVVYSYTEGSASIQKRWCRDIGFLDYIIEIIKKLQICVNDVFSSEHESVIYADEGADEEAPDEEIPDEEGPAEEFVPDAFGDEPALYQGMGLAEGRRELSMSFCDDDIRSNETPPGLDDADDFFEKLLEEINKIKLSVARRHFLLNHEAGPAEGPDLDDILQKMVAASSFDYRNKMLGKAESCAPAVAPGPALLAVPVMPMPPVVLEFPASYTDKLTAGASSSSSSFFAACSTKDYFSLEEDFENTKRKPSAGESDHSEGEYEDEVGQPKEQKRPRK